MLSATTVVAAADLNNRLLATSSDSSYDDTARPVGCDRVGCTLSGTELTAGCLFLSCRTTSSALWLRTAPVMNHTSPGSPPGVIDEEVIGHTRSSTQYDRTSEPLLELCWVNTVQLTEMNTLRYAAYRKAPLTSTVHTSIMAEERDTV